MHQLFLHLECITITLRSYIVELREDRTILCVLIQTTFIVNSSRVFIIIAVLSDFRHVHFRCISCTECLDLTRWRPTHLQHFSLLIGAIAMRCWHRVSCLSFLSTARFVCLYFHAYPFASKTCWCLHLTGYVSTLGKHLVAWTWWIIVFAEGWKSCLNIYIHHSWSNKLLLLVFLGLWFEFYALKLQKFCILLL